MIKQRSYISSTKTGSLVACSDPAGEVEEVGEDVKLFKKVGDLCCRG
jgi:NADPH:quinone reductase-like Zn-dependent oxidoreductase